jgi:hypothetical protein
MRHKFTAKKTQPNRERIEKKDKSAVRYNYFLKTINVREHII